MKVLILYGSDSDIPRLEKGREYFEQEGVDYEEQVLSAHRDFDRLKPEFQKFNQDEELAAVIAVAGLSAALPGVVASGVKVPVIGVPIATGPLNGLDALLSITQVPGGVPAVSVGIHKRAPLNACMFAKKILEMAEGK